MKTEYLIAVFTGTDSCGYVQSQAYELIITFPAGKPFITNSMGLGAVEYDSYGAFARNWRIVGSWKSKPVEIPSNCVLVGAEAVKLYADETGQVKMTAPQLPSFHDVMAAEIALRKAAQAVGVTFEKAVKDINSSFERKPYEKPELRRNVVTIGTLPGVYLIASPGLKGNDTTGTAFKVPEWVKGTWTHHGDRLTAEVVLSRKETSNTLFTKGEKCIFHCTVHLATGEVFLMNKAGKSHEYSEKNFLSKWDLIRTLMPEADTAKPVPAPEPEKVPLSKEQRSLKKLESMLRHKELKMVFSERELNGAWQVFQRLKEALS